MINKNDYNTKVLTEVIGDTTLTCVECSLIGSTERTSFIFMESSLG